MKRLFPAVCLFSCVIAAHSFAGSATWTSNPTSGDWYTATNWTPATVPNGPSDIATFANSSINNVTVSATTTEVAEIVFNAAATSSFNLNIGTGQTFTISGVGVVNDSGLNQNFFVGVNDSSTGTLLKFQNTATAGTSDVTYTADSADVFDYNEVFFYGNSTAGSANFVAYGANHGVDAGGGLFNFYENSTAGNANFTINGATTKNSYGGSAGFADFATAGNATFVLNPGTKDDFDGGHMGFRGNATAGDAVFTLNGATAAFTETAISFTDAATAGNGFFTVVGGHKSSGSGGDMYFYVTDDELIPTAGNATIIVEGGTVTGASGGTLRFNDASTAGQALIVVHGGENGGAAGRISFFDESDGGEAQIEVYDDGFLDIRSRSTPSVTIGSLAGDGLVHLGGHSLIVGSNNLDTTFSGTIDGGTAGLAKIGSGTLTLSGANTYTGTTTVSAGVLRIGNKAGSATGTGAVNVNAGAVGGNGTVTGPTTVGTGSGAGAFLQPGVGASNPTTLTVQGLLTFKSDGTYTYKLNTNKAKADQVLATGVSIELGALFDLNTVANKKLTIGKVFTAISNTAAAPISGTFANLADGSTFTVGRNKFQTSYSGGDGNDLTLTVVQ